MGAHTAQLTHLNRGAHVTLLQHSCHRPLFRSPALRPNALRAPRARSPHHPRMHLCGREALASSCRHSRQGLPNRPIPLVVVPRGTSLRPCLHDARPRALPHLHDGTILRSPAEMTGRRMPRRPGDRHRFGAPCVERKRAGCLCMHWMPCGQARPSDALRFRNERHRPARISETYSGRHLGRLAAQRNAACRRACRPRKNNAGKHQCNNHRCNARQRKRAL